MQGAHENLFKSVALVHPSFFQPEDADNVNVPVALLPSGGEDQAVMNGYWERIQQKPIAKNSIRQDFVRTFPLATTLTTSLCLFCQTFNPQPS